MTQTATTTKPQSMTWPTFRAAVLKWRDEQTDSRKADNAAFNIIHAARDFGGSIFEVMEMHAHAVQNLSKYAELSEKTAIRALQYHIERDYYTAQGDEERAAELTRSLAYWGV